MVHIMILILTYVIFSAHSQSIKRDEHIACYCSIAVIATAQVVMQQVSVLQLVLTIPVIKCLWCSSAKLNKYIC